MQKKGTIHSPLKRKVLLLLEAGISLSFTRSVGKQKKIIRAAKKAWREIDRKWLYRCLDEFRHASLVNYKERGDGTIDIVLSEQGQRRALSFQLDSLQLPQPKHWDGTWRLVLYDIPDAKKAARHALQYKFKELGFHQWQKSVMVYPFPCHDEVDFVIEVFNLRPYVRYAEMKNPTNEAELKIKFNLT